MSKDVKLTLLIIYYIFPVLNSCCFLRFEDHLKSRQKDFKLFYWSETCLAALDCWFSQHELILHIKKKIFVSFFIKKKWQFLIQNPESFCWLSGWFRQSSLQQLGREMFSMVDSRRPVVDPSRPARPVGVSAAPLLFHSSGSWARRRPAELLLFLTFLHKRPQRGWGQQKF